LTYQSLKKIVKIVSPVKIKIQKILKAIFTMVQTVVKWRSSFVLIFKGKQVGTNKLSVRATG